MIPFKCAPHLLAPDFVRVGGSSYCALDDASKILLVAREALITGKAALDHGKLGGQRVVQENP
jgi:hypothetical protein